jgi:hypothetical protein
VVVGGPGWTRRLWRPHGVDALQLKVKVTVVVPPAGTFAVWGLGLVTVQFAATLEDVSCTW